MGFSSRGVGLALAFAAAVALPAVLHADQITKKDGSVINGTITGVDGGEVTVQTQTSNGGMARVPYQISDIKSVQMAPPSGLAAVKGQSPQQVVALLSPIVKEYAGLPADWVLDAMGDLADAYTALKQDAQASTIYSQINQLYPGSVYTNLATAGEAKLLLQQGQADQALGLIQPVIAAADKTITPAAADAHAYAAAFLVYGQILQAQKKYPEALEAYLTIPTMFYQPQNQSYIDASAELVKNLRVQDPGVSVN